MVKIAIVGMTALVFLAFLNLVGFDSFPENPPLDRVDASRGYSSGNLDPGQNNTDENFVILSLSGGGIRAAALGYGILQHLRSISLDGGGKTLLDEVDVMTTSSTSSAVAAYYGLFGEEKFFRDFKEEFLHHELEKAMVMRLLNPLNWPRLISPLFSRSEIAMEYMDELFFKGRTFGEMPRRRRISS